MEAKAHIKRLAALKEARRNFDTQWQEVAEYVLPKRADFTRTNEKGDQRTHRGYDSTPMWANGQLAAALHGMLTSPSMPWFTVEPVDPKLRDNEEVRRWFEAATRLMRDTFNDPATNFQSQIHEVFLDICAFGVGCLYVGRDPEFGGPRFSARPISEIYLSEDAQGRIDTVYRSFKMTARQAAQKYGDAVGRECLDDAKDAPDKKHAFLHAVTPHPKIQGAWVSCEISVQEEAKLAQQVLRVMPYLTPRWSKVAGEAYGRSPAMEALPDIRMIDAMMRTIITTAEKRVAPPLIVPDDGFIEPIDTSPGALIFAKEGFSIAEQAALRPLEIGDPTIGLDLAERVREQILRAFNVEWFNLREGPAMTATEVTVRQQERMRLIGPMIGRLQTELLQPLLNTVFALLLRVAKKALPPLPQVLQQTMMDGQEQPSMQVVFVSQAAKALRASETQAIQAVLGYAAEVARVDPAALDFVDVPESLKRYADAVGAPSEVIRSDDEAEAKAKERAEQQQMMMMMQMQAAQAETAKTASETAKNVSQATAGAGGQGQAAR